ncbi:DUF427 domain-containing protein [Actinomycetes bacterium M1A6_2h]
MSDSNSNSMPDRTLAPNGVIATQPLNKRLRVTFAGEDVVDTTGAIHLLEKGHRPTYYIPLADVRSDYLEETNTSTVCPRKGTARYWSLVVGQRRSDDALWSYPNRYDDALDLSDYVSFYWDRVDEWFEDEVSITEPSTPAGPAL